jgi:hypothetical protein
MCPCGKQLAHRSPGAHAYLLVLPFALDMNSHALDIGLADDGDDSVSNYER